MGHYGRVLFSLALELSALLICMLVRDHEKRGSTGFI